MVTKQTRHKKNQENMAQSMAQNKSLESNPKETQNHELPKKIENNHLKEAQCITRERRQLKSEKCKIDKLRITTKRWKLQKSAKQKFWS